MKYIYLRTNTINGKKYIGQTCNLKRRERDWKQLKSKYSNKEIDEDRVRYGFDAFKLDLLEICEDEIADEREQLYIQKYNTLTPNGYNVYSGGIKGFTFKMNEDIKKKISDKEKGRKLSDETKRKIGIGHRNHPNKSKKVYQYDLNGNLVDIFPSAREASRQLNFSQANISTCCNGGFFHKKRNKWVNRIQYNGYIWSYEPL